PFAYSQGTSTLCITRSRYSSSATPPTRFYPLSLHDALPISGECLPPLEPEPPLETTALGKAAPPHRAYSQDTRLSTGRGWAIMWSDLNANASFFSASRTSRRPRGWSRRDWKDRILRWRAGRERGGRGAPGSRGR